MTALRLGLLSTAKINDQILRAAKRTDLVAVTAVGSRDRAPRRGLRRRARHRARPRVVRRPPRRPRRRRGVHLAAERDAPCVDDARARRRQARPLREAVHPASGRGRGGLGARRRARARADGGVHVPAPSADGARARARRERRDRPAARDPRRRSASSSTTPANVRNSLELAGGSLMDIGCYCVSGARLLGGEPEEVMGEQVLSSTGVDLAFTGILRFPGDVVAQIDCSFAAQERQRLEAIGEEGHDPSSPAPGAPTSAARSRSSATDGPSWSTFPSSTATASSSTTSPTRLPVARPSSSGGRTRSARHGRSRRSTGRRPSGASSARARRSGRRSPRHCPGGPTR